MNTVLTPGMLVGQRFVVEAATGKGGMGTVYRGHDMLRGETVAIKLLRASIGGSDQSERFAREVQILAELSHPGIVSYIAHGVIETGQPFLAMQWLEGEDLSQRLRRQPLSPRESMILLRRVADALSVAHRQNIVHRDLKPSNLFLRDCEVDLVTIVDFGIARRVAHTTAVTRTGLIIGTPEYMAPEQARGQRDVGASADIFSLGCVLYECLTGEPPFAADVMAGVMAKILFEPAPLLRSRRPNLPEWVDQLLAQMLEKEPSLRLQDAAQLLETLNALETELDDSVPLAGKPSTRSSAGPPVEQQLVCVLLSAVPSLAPAWDSDTNIASPAGTEPAKELQRELALFGAKVEILADGSIIALLTQRSHMAATDQAAQAARCALALRQRFPDSVSTVTTGRALLGGHLPLGEAFERSARLRTVGLERDLSSGPPGGEIILIDAVTAGLLDARFEVRRLATGVFALRGERLSVDETRQLLGHPTPCVGRDRELAILDLLFSECRDDYSARIALIIAPAGMGKSRLRHEFVRRLKSRNEPVQVLVGRGDPLLTGSPYALLGQTIRQLCGISEREGGEEQQLKLQQHIQARLPAADVQRVTEFIGEPFGLRVGEGESAQLRAARNDARTMTEQVHRAFIDLLRAECTEVPLLIILEDLHWSDTPTVRLVDAALRELGECRLMVLALSRPEIETLYPRLWSERRCQDLRLEGLNKRASERLVRQVLGATTSGTVVTRIVEQSAGNPLFLEELIRAVAEGKGDEMPETVLAMLQSRLLRLDPSARHVLRTASIFGQTFWRGGLVQLLRFEPGNHDVDFWLQRLVESEVLESQRESRFGSDPQYRFRHALLRDAAYSLLTAESCRQGHRLAAQYLEQMEDSDPLVLAEHCERGDDLARAGSYYLRAAEQAHRRGDADTAGARARKGLDCGPDEIARRGLLVVLCQVHLWRNQWAQAAAYADDVMRLAEPGSPSWVIAATARLVDARFLHRHRFMASLSAIRTVEPEIDAVSTMAFALATGVYLLDSASEFTLAHSFLARLHDIVDPVAAYNPLARAWMYRAHAHREAWVHADPWAGLQYAEQMRDSFLEADHIRGALDGKVFIGMNALYLGESERALRELRETLAMGDDMGLLSSVRSLLYVHALCACGKLEEAEQAARAMAHRNDPTEMTWRRGLWALGEALYHRGQYAAAEQSLTEALACFGEYPLDYASAQVTLAAVQLKQGRAEQALASAASALQRLTSLGSLGVRGAGVYLVYAEALLATGDRAQAGQVVEQALAWVQQVGARISDPAVRERFLHAQPEHRQLAALSEMLRRQAS